MWQELLDTFICAFTGSVDWGATAMLQTVSGSRVWKCLRSSVEAA